MEATSEVDSIILLSGDGDFALLLGHITHKYGIETQVYGVPQLTAKALIDSAAKSHEIDGSLLQ